MAHCHEVPAPRASKNRPAGTPVWKNVTVNTQECTMLLLNNVIPSIIERWPTDDLYAQGVTIQHDGAPAHKALPNQAWYDGLDEVGMRPFIKLSREPPNSPDTNINDLGFFASLQSEYYLTNPANLREIVDMVPVGKSSNI